MLEGFKKWWATKPWTRILPYAPSLSFGKAREWYEKQKDSAIKAVKKLSLPMFLFIVILVLILIFWNKIMKLFGIR